VYVGDNVNYIQVLAINPKLCIAYGNISYVDSDDSIPLPKLKSLFMSKRDAGELSETEIEMCVTELPQVDDVLNVNNIPEKKSKEFVSLMDPERSVSVSCPNLGKVIS
jgi:hypothetical protein